MKKTILALSLIVLLAGGFTFKNAQASKGTLPIVEDIIGMYPYPDELPLDLQEEALTKLYHEFGSEPLIRIRLALMYYEYQINQPPSK